MKAFPYWLIKALFICMAGKLLGDEEEVQKKTRRVQAHLLVKDYHSAYEEVKEALQLDPHSSILHEKYIRTLARLGRENEMLAAWRSYLERYPEQKENRPLIEAMAWGALDKASLASSLVTRQMALLAAFFCQEARGVSILQQGMRDSNYAIRALAVQLAGHLHDARLIAEIKRLFKEEKMRQVRQEVIKAIGKMKLIELRASLEDLIASEISPSEDKALAIESLVHLFDAMQENEIKRLAFSNRAGLRLLACKVIVHLSSVRDLQILYDLTQDSNPQVRAAAFQAIGLLRPREEKELVLLCARKGTQDLHFKAAISAAWLLSLYQPEEGNARLKDYLMSPKQEVRLMASAAVAAAGAYASPLALQYFESHSDPFVRLSLALGLIGQRMACPEAGHVIKEIITHDKQNWCEVEFGHFTAISNRHFAQTDEDSSREMDNQLARLRILNILAILKEPGTQEAIRQFLAERAWGISGAAAALLLTEGDDEAVALVQQLLQDKEARVRLQAALVLSLWSREETPIQELERGYAHSEMDLKLKIIEGLGRIGSMDSVPFLIERLEEPSQTLRLIAAMALIQCLNH
ncbi:MAG: HEAT repeat domain-containing protein [Candidatus Protochlamydia sp.]|nr:HEAT repeat domain-containing protein [Candidatus Protochlamydia sp.]